MRLLILAQATAIFGLAAAFAFAGCTEGRFPTCKDSPECVKSTDGGAPVCFDLRCVECAYDVDCPTGKVCNSSKTCESLGGNTAANQGEGDAGDQTRWEGGTWDECAKDCKDQDCIHSCDSRFPKSSSSASAKKPPPKPPGK